MEKGIVINGVFYILSYTTSFGESRCEQCSLNFKNCDHICVTYFGPFLFIRDTNTNPIIKEGLILYNNTALVPELSEHDCSHCAWFDTCNCGTCLSKLWQNKKIGCMKKYLKRWKK